MRVLAFSGRSIAWPANCACCCREADTSVRVDKTVEDSSYNWFTRTTTTRSETRGWDVPYCKKCLEHIHEERTHLAFAPSATHGSWAVASLGTIGAVAILAANVKSGWTNQEYYVLMLALAAAVLVLTGVTYPWCRDRYRRAEAVIAERKAALKARVDACVCETCSSRGRLAVRYEGWSEKSHYGEWREETHRFAFESDLFAEAMQEINGENCKREPGAGA